MVIMKKKIKSTKTKKHAGGRPSKFPKINLKQVKFLYLDGKTDKQVADFLEIDIATLHRWKEKHSKFCDTLKDWKKEADAKVEKSLYKRAVGYEYNEVTYEKSKTGGLGIMLEGGDIEAIKDGDTSKTKIVVKEVAPDVTAQIFWLKNRRPGEWKDRIDHKHDGEVTINQIFTPEKDAE